MRYHPNMPLVLKGVTFTVSAGQKVGIVGRTGSGKSSLLVALWRLTEPCGGRILLDGLDTQLLKLSDLRDHISAVPQDPVLFSGTIRSNLDPLNEHSDDEMWRALKAVRLEQLVNGEEGGLEMSVAEYGENLSTGQRQLLCLARAMLRKS